MFKCAWQTNMIQIKHNRLRIPTGGRLTNWLFTQRGKSWIRGHRRQIHLAAGTRIWARDLWITSSAPYHQATLAFLKCYNGLIPDGKVIDHRNNNEIDNQLENLQLLFLFVTAYKDLLFLKETLISISDNLKTLSISNFKESLKYDLVKDY